ncbi:MAG: acetyl-CoA carboxylase carboxyl transferase subunit beta [Candidatus Marinimicrobia bacterium]|nr:acetyl-CoA carboxylase carboxyl transferase subunit beta [Candidatus Neomarinimicrobiota bacterium]|tara:strand:- start:147 stop:989 length:843 start_codon:yes stop_codon:yes gene_type:complete
MAEWFRRSAEKIITYDKREIAEGTWIKCPKCSTVIYHKQLEKNYHVCISCSHHFRMKSTDYIQLLFQDASIQEIGENIVSKDPLNFNASKSYKDQIKISKNKTGLTEAVKSVKGEINGIPIIVCIMDFSFIGGSMGSVVGERISRAIDVARKEKRSLIIITSSGGARMQEGALSLMQMAKTSAKLAQFSKEGGLYITVLTDPTTGGTTASYAMLGDIILAEPNSLIGFAGARVIKQTIGEDLPEGFQRAEFLLEKGFVDHIVHRKDLKQKLSFLINFFNN